MHRKRERVHETGASNIDFRSKRDNSSLNLFQPWKKSIQNLTKDNPYQTKPEQEMSNLMKIAKNVLTNREKNSQIISPKLLPSLKYYTINKIPLKKRAYFNSDKVAELDESYIGKPKYNGDSNILPTDTRFSVLKHSLSSRPNEGITYLLRGLSHPFLEKQHKKKNGIGDTQHNTIKACQTEHDSVDLLKIRDIKLAIRRRYQNRNNIAKIFKEWDISNHGVITINDAHKMINKLGIPINILESKAFIQSSNFDNKESLDLENFIKLIFSDNHIDYLVRIASSKDANEGLKTESNDDKCIKKYLNRQNEVENLKAFIRTRIPILVKNFTNKNVKDALCDLPLFSNVIKSLRICGIFSDPEIIAQLFNEYKNNDNLVDYKKFVDSITVSKEKNFFFAFQENYLDLLEKKEHTNKLQLAKFREDNTKLIQAEEELIKRKKEVLDEQVFNKQNRLKFNSYDDKYVRNSQPSKEFFMHIWDNNKDYTIKRNDIIKSFEPTILFKGKIS